MSLERVLNMLTSLGLTQTEAEIYVFLAKKGPHRRDDLANTLNVTVQQLHPSLMNLQEKGFINSTFEDDTLFSAIPFEKVLDNLTETGIEEAQRIEREKEDFLST